MIRLARRAKGATQRQTGDACGYSQSEISRIENGRARVHDIRTLERLAGSPGHPSPAPWAGAVRQRPGLVRETTRLPQRCRQRGRGSDAHRQRRRGLSDLLTLSGPAPHDSPTLVGLEKRIAAAHAIYQRGEYQHVADGLPALIGSTTNGTVLAEDERSRQRVLAAQGWSFVLAAKLATKFDDAPTARLAADRAITAGTFSASRGLAGRSHLPVGLCSGGWRRTRSRRTGRCHRRRPPGRGERPRPCPDLCAGRPAADRRDRRVRLRATQPHRAGISPMPSTSPSASAQTATTRGPASDRPTSAPMRWPPRCGSTSQTARWRSPTRSTPTASLRVSWAAAARFTLRPRSPTLDKARTRRRSNTWPASSAWDRRFSATTSRRNS